MQRYEKYKDSGVAWIGEIPENWEVKRLKYCLRAKITDGPHETPEFLSDGIPFLSVDGIQNGELVFDGCRKISKEDFNRYQEKCKIELHDLLMGKAASIGKIAQVKTKKVFTIWSPLALIKPSLKILNSTFLEYFLKSEYAQYNLVQLSTFNTQRNISMQDIPKLILVTPNIIEQKKISNFLDKKTKEIDTLIDQKEQLLKLYEEEKRAIINRAMTDEVEVYIRLKYLISKIGSGVTPRGGASVYKLQGIPLLRSQNIYFDGLRLEKVVYITEETHAKMENSQVHQGDVLLNITGASIGRCYYVPIDLVEANVNQHVCIIRPTEKILTEFLYFVLRSNLGQEQIIQEQTGSGREGLNLEALKNFLIPYIEVDKQQIIIDSIKSKLLIIDNKIQKTKDIITLQKEYRTALISEVVTGKIKVTEEEV